VTGAKHGLPEGPSRSLGARDARVGEDARKVTSHNGSRLFALHEPDELL